MEKTEQLESLEMEQVARGIMQEDPVMAKYTNLIAKATQGENLTEKEQEYLHVMTLLEKRDVRAKYGDIYAEEGDEAEQESA